uniref:Putative ovule protein n=1 Tax=Solanum chacoense TaxID=4108 RepID=A0A0V0H2Z3_SOLCH
MAIGQKPKDNNFDQKQTKQYPTVKNPIKVQIPLYQKHKFSRKTKKDKRFMINYDGNNPKIRTSSKTAKQYPIIDKLIEVQIPLYQQHKYLNYNCIIPQRSQLLSTKAKTISNT